MIHVLVTLIPASDPSNPKILQEMIICNDGTGTADEGNYDVKVSHCTNVSGQKQGFMTFGRPAPREVWRSGKVYSFKRSLSPVTLVLRALKAVL